MNTLSAIRIALTAAKRVIAVHTAVVIAAVVGAALIQISDIHATVAVIVRNPA